MDHSRSYLLHKPRNTARRKRKLAVALIALMLLVLTVVFSVNLVSSFRSIHNSADWARALRLQKGGDERVYLIYGIDCWGANPYVDRLLLLHHNTANQNVSLLYIPGNTLVKTEDNLPAPLGRLYHELEGPDFIDLVQKLTGIAVHHYVAIDYQGIMVMGDYLGGIDSELLRGGEEDGDILLPEELERLKGWELYRYFLTANFHEQPWEHLKRQQKVLAAIWKGMEQKKTWHWPKMVRVLSPHLETDLSWRELTALREQFAEYDFDEMILLSLPGEEKVITGFHCWKPDKKSLKRTVRLLNEGYLVNPEDVQIEVLNGSGIDGLAAEVAALLEQEGFQVTRTGNADHFNYTETEAIALGKTVDKARAAALHLPGASVLHRREREASADVRVVIGSDFAENPDGS